MAGAGHCTAVSHLPSKLPTAQQQNNATFGQTWAWLELLSCTSRTWTYDELQNFLLYFYFQICSNVTSIVRVPAVVQATCLSNWTSSVSSTCRSSSLAHIRITIYSPLKQHSPTVLSIDNTTKMISVDSLQFLNVTDAVEQR